MPITDNIIFRMRAQSGQAAPINEVGANETLSGSGSLSLVTAGDHHAWRLSGGGASAAVPSETIAQATDGGGVTIAMRMRIPTFNGTAFDSLVGFSTDATPSNGVFVGQAGAGTTIRARYKTEMTAAIGTIGNSEFTIVIRAKMLAATGSDLVEVWIGTTGRPDTDPDFVSAAATNATTAVLDTIAWLTAGSGVIEVANQVVFSTERTNTECANLADDIVGQLYGSGVDLTTADSTQDATSGTGAVTVDPPSGGTVNLACADTTQAATSGTGAATIDHVATVTSDQFYNYSGILQSGVTIPNVMLIELDRTVALSLADQVTNGSGRLIIPSVLLVAGTEYMLATFNADGTLRGLKKHTAT
jgi:hypothetical protein